MTEAEAVAEARRLNDEGHPPYRRWFAIQSPVDGWGVVLLASLAR